MQEHDAMAFLLHHTAPMVSRATGFHHPLDRLDLLLYISRECPGIEPLAPIHSADLDTLGNLVNGLGLINRYAFIAPLPANSHHGVIEETWCGESPLQPSNRSLRSLGPAKAGPLTKR
jgi:hypothetical protein